MTIVVTIVLKYTRPILLAVTVKLLISKVGNFHIATWHPILGVSLQTGFLQSTVHNRIVGGQVIIGIMHTGCCAA